METLFLANAASCPQLEGEMCTCQSSVTLCGWEVKAGMAHSTCV